MAQQQVSFKLNGKAVGVSVEARELLIHTLREKLAHTGPHIGCETSHCGACTVDLDGMSVKSCTVLTVQCQDADVLTVEGLGDKLDCMPCRKHSTRSTRCSAATARRDDHARHRLPGNAQSDGEEIRYRMAAICAAAPATKTSSRRWITRRRKWRRRRPDRYLEQYGGMHLLNLNLALRREDQNGQFR